MNNNLDTLRPVDREALVRRHYSMSMDEYISIRDSAAKLIDDSYDSNELEVDLFPFISPGEGGAFVAVWLWVPNNAPEQLSLF